MKRSDIPKAQIHERELKELDQAIDKLRTRGPLLRATLTFRNGQETITLIEEEVLGEVQKSVLAALGQTQAETKDKIDQL